MTIYIIGVLVALIIGIFGLTTTKNTECTIEQITCIFTAMLMSLLSWALVLIFVLVTLRAYYVKDD